ncbi:MAG TPA: c-type cytochrome, partial [Candidatus Baltobacteraceae bacterium]|nr:c-type cytochrome [Candidatus Baltobacteraceae bacterium]
MSNEFMYNLAYLTNSGPTSSALDYNSSGNIPTWDLNVSYGGMSVPYSIGVVGIQGWAPLHYAGTNSFAATDPFSREGAYLGYQTNAWHLQTMYYHGFDARPDVNEYGVSLNGFFFEAERDLGWRNHVAVRYDVASSDTLNRQYVLDVSHNLQPNIALVGQAAAGPQQRPQFGFQLAFAGPYQSDKRYVVQPNGGAKAVGIGVVPAGHSVSTIQSPSQAAQPAPEGSAGDVNAGAKLVQANGCTGCHGATWRGALGPALYGIEHRMTPLQIALHVKSPTAPMPNFGFTDAQIGDIVAYLSSLDGGLEQNKPVVTFVPETPSEYATVSVRFNGTPPSSVTVLPIMHMGATSMQTQAITLQPSPGDPHVFTGRITFSMSGPWTVRIRYGDQTLDVPLTVGS